MTEKKNFSALSPEAKHALIKRITSKPAGEPQQSHNCFNPTRTQLLALFGLDKMFVTGNGSVVCDDEGGEYIDFLSQYGALPFGHNPGNIWNAIRRFESSKMPTMVQPFVPHEASRLARRLAQLAPGDLEICTFANSGAEVVEIAIKLARVRTGRRVILSTRNGFHGKTLGALSATGREQYQKPFGLPLPDFEHIQFGDLDALSDRLRARADVAGFIVEPIQGEGGVVPAPPGYLKAVIALCKAHGVLSIVDEIQTGLGRTGSLFALPEASDAPDMLLLAKALGGGLVPIGVCIVTRDAWDDQFGRLHSSTFAGNNLACSVALAVLEHLTDNNQQLVRDVHFKGQHLLSSLRVLQEAYPAVIKDVRGYGLMVGLEFHSYGEDSNSGLLSYCSLNESLVPLVSAYLVNDHALITAPMFNSSHVLRLQPALTITLPQIDRAVQAINITCDALARRDIRQLIHHLVRDDGASTNLGDVNGSHYGEKIKQRPIGDLTESEPDQHFAFLLHYLTEDDYVRMEPSLTHLTSSEMSSWQNWCRQVEPGLIRKIKRITSPAGNSVQGDLIVLPMLPRDLLAMGKEKVTAVLSKAISQAQARGATYVGLGGFTSIMSQGGQTLLKSDLHVTSGNTLTAVMAVQGIEDIANRLNLDVETAHVAVVGATGSIGRLVSLLASRQVNRITLIGSPTSVNFSARSQEIITEIHQESRRSRQATVPSVTASLNLRDSLWDADIVIVATSAEHALIETCDLKPGSVVGDISRPPNVQFVVTAERSSLVFDAGLVQLPEAVDMGPVTGLQPGLCWGCLAETILLAMEGETGNVVGQNLSLEYADHLSWLANKHHFRLAPPHWYGTPLTSNDFARIQNSLPPSSVYTSQ